MNDLIAKENLSAIKSMSNYWREVSRRDDNGSTNKDLAFHSELSSLVGYVGAEAILMIVAEYVDKQLED